MKTDHQNWQKWMLDALVNPNQTNPAEIAERFTSNGQLSTSQCLGIYQRGYILRLTKCLAEQFPALNAALGEPLFNRFAQRYLSLCPSDSYTLYELGRRFADFLQQDRPDHDLPAQQRESWIDFMVDLAHYERLHFSLFDAPGNEGGDRPKPDTPDQQLVLQPCFALAQYQFPVAWYYHAVKENPSINIPPKQQSYVALVRTDYQVTTYPINQYHYEFLQHLQKNSDLAAALAYVSNKTQVALSKVTQSWKDEVKGRWINAGFFALA